MARHAQLTVATDLPVYFAHPHSPWERPSNENTNGLLRQYFPKSMELTDITEKQVLEAVERINHRPRKVLGFKTPHEVFFGVKLLYTKQPLAVALRT